MKRYFVVKLAILLSQRINSKCQCCSKHSFSFSLLQNKLGCFKTFGSILTPTRYPTTSGHPSGSGYPTRRVTFNVSPSKIFDTTWKISSQKGKRSSLFRRRGLTYFAPPYGFPQTLNSAPDDNSRHRQTV
jgi:hypothetical protein